MHYPFQQLVVDNLEVNVTTFRLITSTLPLKHLAQKVRILSSKSVEEFLSCILILGAMQLNQYFSNNTVPNSFFFFLSHPTKSYILYYIWTPQREKI